MENTPMENTAAENSKPNSSPDSPSEPESALQAPNSNPSAGANPPSRTPFTSLDQLDADLALARALQEQERAYLMLRMEGVEVSGYGSSETGSYVYEDELEGHGEDDLHLDYHDDGLVSVEDSDYGDDANEEELNPADFESDEAFARALQDAEEREMAARLMALAGFYDRGSVVRGDIVSHGDLVSQFQSQDAWQGMDPDEYLYEELVVLGDAVGTESRGLSSDTIASLPSVDYKAPHDDNAEQCVICRLEYEDGDSLVVLSCKHLYHPECINQWLQINKVCPICSSEVSTSSGH